MDDEIEFIETSKSDAFQTFDAIIERCNSEISKLILGQTATTDEKSFVGSANVHERQANSITWQDKHQIQLWLNEFILPLANINATFHWITADDLPLEKQWNIHRDMIQLGLPVDLEFIAQKYNTPFYDLKTNQNPKNQPQNLIQNENENSFTFETPYIEYRLNPFQKFLNWFKNTFFFNLKDKDLLEIHQNQKPSQKLFDYFANELTQSLEKGFKNPQKNPELYLKLKQNLLEFAIGKHYAFLQSDKPLLHKNYLITEKNTALAQAQMASQFVDWVNNDAKLRYQTAKDDKVRENHRLLDGIVKPANDPFWIGKTPPLGWNCRCNLVEINQEERNTDKNIPNEIYDPNFQGIHAFFEQKIFSTQHVYFQYGDFAKAQKDGLKFQDLKPIITKAEEYQIRNIDKWEKLFFDIKSGGYIVKSKIYQEKNDYIDLIKVAQIFAHNGDTVEILNNFHFKSDEYKYYFGELIGTIFEKKCPDFKINNQFFEFEKGKNNQNKNDKKRLSNAVRNGSSQSDNLIIYCENEPSKIRYLLKISRNKTYLKIWIYDEKKNIIKRIK